MALTRIFEPIKIRNVTIPNRIVRAAHGTHLGRHAFDDDSIAYHVARAKGGCGLTIIEAASVHTSSENMPFDDFEILVGHRLVEIAHGVTTVPPFQSRKPRNIDADTVVLITANAPLRSLYDELRQHHRNIALVGDALAPRDLQAAIAEGHRTMREFV